MSRRRWVQAAAASLCGWSSSGWLPALAQEITTAAEHRRLIVLWMSGGPSQTDTFDMKPGHANGGEFAEAVTSVPGLRFSEHLPKLARQADRLAVVRSVSTKEGDHGRASYLVRTGQAPAGPLQLPCFTASLAKALAPASSGVPPYVSIAPHAAVNAAAFSPGFLGPRHAPLTVAAETPSANPAAQEDDYADLRVDNLSPAAGIDAEQFTRRVELWKMLQDGFLKDHPEAAAPQSHQTIYQRALELMDSDVVQAFDLSEEPTKVRDVYGPGQFGQGCLMARRLIERGVPVVEVSLGISPTDQTGWDTHQDNFPAVQRLSAELDAGWSTLMTELDERGLLADTTLLWIGEFGRTPQINANAGRDHFPAAWSCVFAGGGIAGGQAYGHTSEDGTAIEGGKVSIGDILATLCTALGIAPETENISDVGRPIKLAEGTPIKAILT
jgi:hypothetical protein